MCGDALALFREARDRTPGCVAYRHVADPQPCTLLSSVTGLASKFAWQHGAEVTSARARV
jgi:hypothetical protein